MDNHVVVLYLLDGIHYWLYTPKMRRLHLRERFDRKLPIQLVDGQLPDSCVSTRSHPSAGRIRLQLVYFIYRSVFEVNYPYSWWMDSYLVVVYLLE